MDNIKYVRDRITELRIKKGVSEYQMSYDLGHSKGYINNISSGKSLPSLNEFFLICEYFSITPIDFFDNKLRYPELINKAVEGLNLLNDKDILMILGFINRLNEKDLPEK